MSIDAQKLTAMVDGELAQLSDSRVVAHIATLREEPSIMMLRWDYGLENERYPCWIVFRHPATNIAIAYCSMGLARARLGGLYFLEVTKRTGP